MLLGRTTWLGCLKKHTSIYRPLWWSVFAILPQDRMYDITTTSVCIRFPPKTQGRYHLVHVICCLLTDAWQLKSKHAGSPEKYERKFLIELSRALRHNLDNIVIFLPLNRRRKVWGIHTEDFLYRLGPVSLLMIRAHSFVLPFCPIIKQFAVEYFQGKLHVIYIATLLSQCQHLLGGVVFCKIRLR